MIRSIFAKTKWVIAVAFVIMIVGFLFWFISFLSVMNNQQILSDSNILTGDFYRYEGALQWWRSAYQTVFLPLSVGLIGFGLVILIYVLLKRDLNVGPS